MNESDKDFTASIFDPDGFKQRVADEMGLDSTAPLTVTRLGDTMYRVDLIMGKYHANSVALALSCEQARNVANCFKGCIIKWTAEDDMTKKVDNIASFHEKYGFEAHPTKYEVTIGEFFTTITGDETLNNLKADAARLGLSLWNITPIVWVGDHYSKFG